MSDTVRAKVQAQHSSSKSGGGQRKVGREYRTLIDWQRASLVSRDINLTPKRMRMTSSRYTLRHNSPDYRAMQVACSRIEPLS